MVLMLIVASTGFCFAETCDPYEKVFNEIMNEYNVTLEYAEIDRSFDLDLEEYKEIITTLAAYQEIAQKIEKELASKQKSSVPLTFSANASAQNLKRVKALAYKTNYADNSEYHA